MPHNEEEILLFPPPKQTPNGKARRTFRFYLVRHLTDFQLVVRKNTKDVMEIK